jgi:basic membrane protein A
MDIRWINTWHDPVLEREGAASLFDAGAQVVFTGADTPAAGEVATEKGKWGVNYDHVSSCTQPGCLTAPYWIWGPVYQEIAEGVRDGSYEVGFHYFDAAERAMGLFGFEEGHELQPGVAELPAEDLALIRETLEAARNGEFTRFDVFSGPIMDNQGNVVVPEGEQIEQADIDQFPPGAPGLECQYCMYWWAEGITAELPELGG